VHGIGDAKTMALRRKSPREVIEQLERTGAVGEAFGYYFNRSGEIVHRIQTVGLQLQDLVHVEKIVAIAGGASKAEAISAICPMLSKETLITDEGAACAILGQTVHS
jgi:central glycolytic genes regulator